MSSSNVFISLQLASNNPENLLRLFDNVEERADRPEQVEVLVKVDEEDAAMVALMEQEATRRRFSLKYLVSPRGAGFADLWKAYNALYELTSKSAYFVCLLSDEVQVNERGWDSVLRRYVGLFPDDIFRLRTTRLKFRNYFDFWECGFAPDSFAFYTKRWLDIVGNWNPCTGPDSSQQFVAYYMGYGTHPAFRQFNRDVPILDLSFSGEGASRGMTEEQRQRRNTVNFREWFKLVSHPMQEELYRRARLLQANILVCEQKDRALQIECDVASKTVVLRDRDSSEIVDLLPFKLSRVRLFLANLRRTLHYHSYAGGGQSSWKMFPFSVIDFLVVYYPGLRKIVGPVITSKTYWILSEMTGLVSRTVRQRQPKLLAVLLDDFEQRHGGWQNTHFIVYRVMAALVVVCRFIEGVRVTLKRRA